ncbi:ATP-binding protein [Piscinibacter sakaiensis]|uniref:sensor histidine kinase n=1 Tax=Piscinibacter sakaiensis TaxID=1547922 RepID=UPI003AB00EC9
MSSRSSDSGLPRVGVDAATGRSTGRFAGWVGRGAASSGTLWLGWRLRLLALAALAACIAILLLAGWVAEQPRIDARWRADAATQLELVSSSDPALQRVMRRRLSSIETPTDTLQFDSADALQAAPRWTTDDQSRAQLEQIHDRLRRAFSHDKLVLHFDNGEAVTVAAGPSRISDLSIVFWLACSVVLMLLLVAVAVVLANPQPHTLLYGLIALCQAGNMAFLAVETALQWGFPPILTRLDADWRTIFDLATGAAVVHATAIHPLRLPQARWISSAAWAAMLLLSVLLLANLLPQAWWWSQIVVAAMGAVALLLLTWSHRIEAHPYAILLRTVGAMALSAWLMLSALAALAESLPNLRVHFHAIGPMLWTMVFSSLLLLLPFLSHSRAALREFALVAGVSTFAAMFDLILVGVFAFGPIGSVTLTFFVAIAAYASARHWLLDRLLGQRRLSTERMFEQLYRIAREVEARPERAPALLMQLLKDLFEPLEVSTDAAAAPQARVEAGGSMMVVPVSLDAGAQQPAVTVKLRFAQRGRRLFIAEDARLADRIVEQLRRAVEFDRAVEHGRVEERQRLAQDLHDDIGARLLTMMYQSTNPEMEDYVRHTLQDLKTLTRGLSTPDQQFSHAAAEWKADLHQRLDAAGVDLRWQCEIDKDFALSVVQWSALTRILRELVSNAIAHARASQVDVGLRLAAGRLVLEVSDNGSGSKPGEWAHGLGLGGVRKRAKQLGGRIRWEQRIPRGIRCVVEIDEFAR